MTTDASAVPIDTDDAVMDLPYVPPGAPVVAADGSLTLPARVTLLHNGVLVQNNSVLKGGTTYIGQPSYHPHGDMPIRLQDHGHLVRYRNIWVRKL